jgi:hypothetical protein
MAGNGATQPRRHVAVIFVHGIHTKKLDFAGTMQAKLLDELDRLSAGSRRFVQFRKVLWANTVRGNQDDYYNEIRRNPNISHSKLRRHIIESLGDAAAYQKTPIRQNSVYYLVHDEISKEIDGLDLPDDKDHALILVGHSLGCHVISTFVYDRNKLKQSTQAEISAEISDPVLREEWLAEWKKLRPEHASPFRRLDTLAGIVTLGNNMPLFTFSFGPRRVKPITVAPEIRRVAGDPDAAQDRQIHPAFPGVALPQPLKDNAQWLNFYSRRDLLGFPLRELYGPVKEITDIAVASENPWLIPYVWCFFAHTGYWTNRRVVRDTAKLIHGVMTTPP